MQEPTDISYAEFKKRRPKWTTRFRRSLEYYFFCFFIYLGQRLSVRRLQSIGKWIGRLAYRILNKDRGIVEKQLEMIFPEKSQEERDVMAKECFLHFGQGMLEFFAMDQFIKNVDQHIKVENPEVLEEVIAEGHAVVLLAMHMGNWELVVPYLLKKGYPTVASTTNFPEPRVNDLIRESRERGNVQLIPRGDPKTVKALLQCFKKKQIFLVAIDQDTNVASTFVPFFGVPAKTPTGVATLTLKYGAVIVSHVVLRQPDGSFLIRFKRLGYYQEKGATEKDVYQLSAELNRHMEDLVKETPEQWAWFHRRWRHRPTEDELKMIELFENES